MYLAENNTEIGFCNKRKRLRVSILSYPILSMSSSEPSFFFIYKFIMDKTTFFVPALKRPNLPTFFFRTLYYTCKKRRSERRRRSRTKKNESKELMDKHHLPIGSAIQMHTAKIH
jgi:hypothetical protein